MEGEPGREMYIIEDGKVEIFKATGSQERQIALLEAGDFFGEMAILEDMPRSASARAMTDCKLLLIDHSTFDQMLREYPETAVRMLRKLSGRLRIASTGPEKVRFPTRPAAAARAPALAAPAGPRQPPDSPKEDEDDARRVGPPEEARPSKAELPARGKLVAHPSGIEFPFPEKAEIKIGRFDSVTGIHPDVDLSAVDTNQIISRRHA